MPSIFRFYKYSDESLEALRIPLIFLYSAKKCEADGEHDFNIDIGSKDEYYNFISKELKKGFALNHADSEFLNFRQQCLNTLGKAGKIEFFDTPIEYDLLLQILFDEATSVEGERAGIMELKTFFFQKAEFAVLPRMTKVLLVLYIGITLQTMAPDFVLSTP